MNYHGIEPDSMVNGEGLRVVVWVSGCSHHCKGCQNPQTWDKDGGEEFTLFSLAKLIKELRKPHVAGVTFSGGDPLYPNNIKTVYFISYLIKALFRGKKTVWVYTGYTYEEVRNLPILNVIDVLVDGEFIEQIKDNTLEWVGSPNQRVIDVKASKEKRRIVIYNGQ